MDTKENQSGKYLVRRRRRHRRRRTYRFCYAAAVVLLLVTAAWLFFSGWRGAPNETGLIGTASAMEGGTGAPEESTWGDREAPVISGVRDFLVYAGDTVSYRSGVTVTDNLDPAPEWTVDTGTVDLSTAGTYYATYVATDAAGNTATAVAAVTVLPRQEGYADLADIYAAADNILGIILPEEVSAREQVEAVYIWARTSLTYGGHSDRSDYRQAAYAMLAGDRGDCYGYFAVTKLLFERLGIPNIDVTKVKNDDADSEHFWSLVSVDGGETYYHFDATPRIGGGDDFCLVTDAFLDAYSEANKGSHNRDKSLYPATPEE